MSWVITYLLADFICTFYPRQGRLCFRHVLSVCLSVCLLATLRKNFWTDLHEIFREVCNGPVNKLLNFSGDPDHRQDAGIVFRIRYNWEIRKVVGLSTDCAALRWTAAIAIATVTSFRHRSTTDSHNRLALAEVCTVPLLLLNHFIGIVILYTSYRRRRIEDILAQAKRLFTSPVNHTYHQYVVTQYVDIDSCCTFWLALVSLRSFLCQPGPGRFFTAWQSRQAHRSRLSIEEFIRVGERTCDCQPS